MASGDSGEQFVELSTGIRLCYRVDGPSGGQPLLLVAGLGLDLYSWPQQMVEGLIARGFRVIRFDNRDIGRSTVISNPPPSRLRRLLAVPRADAYDLADMAADTHELIRISGGRGLRDHAAHRHADQMHPMEVELFQQTACRLTPSASE
ncbi:alpha/beta fold hydrolase [Nocardia sp. XZ_19_385]|uniref:alpha/beta fold hydrolase n=1 Tax=Nocardia sp. XZ_19_385 TaxID=2769488 RepID=UPI001E618EB5|nr:alpha/beta fold hydrolase [Nocardia sp. XZ_19_385]